ncbi:MAG: hypothetical protein GX568_05365 [Candidatus Gastranaerophilales bacterium]|nr:hypothetical protein [Candidatus Gastranaerophilales bacterium]
MISALDTRIKAINCLLAGLIAVFIALNPSNAEVLRGSVSAGDFPAEYYGVWKVMNTLVETNNPDKFLPKSSDYWVFERTGDIITLSNPISGATASITIREIQGKTAIFERAKKTEDYSETETVEITVDGDYFQGMDTIIMNTYFKDGKRVNIQDVVKYKIRGYRLGDSE